MALHNVAAPANVVRVLCRPGRWVTDESPAAGRHMCVPRCRSLEAILPELAAMQRSSAKGAQFTLHPSTALVNPCSI